MFFRDPVRGFVSEGVAKAVGLRRDDSLGGDASASSPEANCIVVNRDSDLPQPQFSGYWGTPSGLRPVGLGYLGVPSCDFRYAKAPHYVRRGT